MPYADLASRLRLAVVRATRRMRSERSSEAISDAQYGFLSALDRHGPHTLRALADTEHVQPPFATRTVAALEADGLVVRTPDPADGRQVLVTITDSGRREVEATRALRNALLAAWIDTLPAADRATLTAACRLLEEWVTP